MDGTILDRVEAAFEAYPHLFEPYCTLQQARIRVAVAASCLRGENPTVGEVSRKLGIPRPTVSREVHRGIAKGNVRLIADPEDERKCRIECDPKRLEEYREVFESVWRDVTGTPFQNTADF